MKVWRAFKIFLFLLGAKEWYIIADNSEGHIVDSHIRFGKFYETVKGHSETFINQEMLLDEAKELLK